MFIIFSSDNDITDLRQKTGGSLFIHFTQQSRSEDICWCKHAHSEPPHWETPEGSCSHAAPQKHLQHQQHGLH